MADDDPRLARINAIAATLPGASGDSNTGQHSNFTVGKKKFTYYRDNHHATAA